MTQVLSRAFCLCVAVLMAACVAYPTGYETVAPVPANFDRSWEAARAAAADVGIQINAADYGQGRMQGSKGDAAVTIMLQRLADGRLEVSFNAPASKEVNPTLQDRWSAAYQRRMGR